MTILFQAKFLVLFIIFLYSDNAYGWRSAKWVNFDGYLILDCKDREVGNSWPKYLPISKKKKKFKVFLNKKDNKWSASKLGVSNKKIARKSSFGDFRRQRRSSLSLSLLMFWIVVWVHHFMQHKPALSAFARITIGQHYCLVDSNLRSTECSPCH